MAAAAIPIIAGLATGVANIFGARSAARKAREAADIQAFAEQDAARLAGNIPMEVNPGISETYLQAGQNTSRVYNEQADIAEQRAREANQLFDPYTGLGTQAAQSLAEFAGPGKTFTAGDLEFDPGYQFRLSEGQKALEKSAAARGGLLGGGTLKALTRYGQEAASQEYAAAFDRFQRGQQNRFSNLSTLANLGYGAAGQQSGNLINQANVAGGYRTGAVDRESQYAIQSRGLQTQIALDAERERRERNVNAAAARAGGVIGSANAWNQGISNAVSGGIGTGMSLWSMMNPMGGMGGRGWVSGSSNPRPVWS